MAMTPYSGETEIIGKLGTTPQERGLTTQQFKDKFDEGLKAFITWFNATHKTEFEAVQTDLEMHKADNSAHGGIYHKNLLHNWDFSNPVNQRGLSVYNQVGYAIDRWRIDMEGIILSIESDCVAIQNTSESRYNLYQSIENAKSLSEKTVTFSAICSGHVSFILGYRKNGNSVYPVTVKHNGEKSLVQFTYTLPESIEALNIYAQPQDGNICRLYRAKLELGSVSTLENDPPAQYGEQLALCKRYYRLWTTAEARAEALKEVGLMRLASPTLGTITIGGTTYYYASADL